MVWRLQTFVRELGASLSPKGLGSTSERGVGASKGSLEGEVGSDVGTSLRGAKKAEEAAEAVRAGGTAFAQDRNLDTAEGSKDDAAGCPVSMEEGMGTGGTGVDVGLSGESSLSESVAHGLATSVDDERLDGLNRGGCGEVDGQGYCKAHGNSSW